MRTWSRVLRTTNWGLVVATLTLLAAVAGVMVNILQLKRQVASVESSVDRVAEGVERVGKDVQTGLFRITDPVDGDSVGIAGVVRGTTRFSGKNHYIVVTHTGTGVGWVQEGPVTISGDLWIGRARFGTANTRPGEEFIVRGLATEASLEPGVLTEVPEDAVFSESVVVIRRRE